MAPAICVQIIGKTLIHFPGIDRNADILRLCRCVLYNYGAEQLPVLEKPVSECKPNLLELTILNFKKTI